MIANKARWLFCLAFFPPLLCAQYQRIINTGKGETRDIAPSHPLTYWTVDPLARDEGGDVCLGCKLPNGHTVSKQDYKVTTDVHHLGELSSHEIVEVIYHLHGGSVGEALWKILLFSPKPGEFAEMYHLQPSGAFVGPFHPARIVSVSGERILTTYDSDGGNGGSCWDGYWWFDKAGPRPVDFEPVYKAIAERTPQDSTVTKGCWTIDLDEDVVKTDVRKSSAECLGCGQLGTATATFEIHGGVAKATSVNFAPVPQE